jgi:hypothetical protein
MIEYEKPNGRREVSMLPMGIDVGNQRGKRHVLSFADLLEAEPKSILEADARLMADNND